jgi:predicted ATPase
LRWIVESKLPLSDLLQNNNISLPTSISKAVGFRLSLLSEVEMRILEIAAIIGFSFDFDQISELTDIPTMQIFDALDELDIRHLLVHQSSAYQFRHELIYHSVLEKISPARRKYLEQSLSGASFK